MNRCMYDRLTEQLISQFEVEQGRQASRRERRECDRLAARLSRKASRHSGRVDVRTSRDNFPSREERKLERRDQPEAGYDETDA